MPRRNPSDPVVHTKSQCRHWRSLQPFPRQLLIVKDLSLYYMNAPNCLQHLIPAFFSTTVVLYNCGDLSGDDCSGCLGLSADYRCGYCQPNCILNSLTCGSSVIQAPNFQQCGAIAVTEVSGVYTALGYDLLTT